jgi:hypothetical protein
MVHPSYITIADIPHHTQAGPAYPLAHVHVQHNTQHAHHNPDATAAVVAAAVVVAVAVAAAAEDTPAEGNTPDHSSQNSYLYTQLGPPLANTDHTLRVVVVVAVAVADADDSAVDAAQES